jgi:hypothetical protein
VRCSRWPPLQPSPRPQLSSSRRPAADSSGPIGSPLYADVDVGPGSSATARRGGRRRNCPGRSRRRLDGPHRSLRPASRWTPWSAPPGTRRLTSRSPTTCVGC